MNLVFVLIIRETCSDGICSLPVEPKGIVQIIHGFGEYSQQIPFI